MNKLLFLMVFLAAVSGVAQPVVFDKVFFDYGYSTVMGSDVQVVPGQGYLIAGSRQDAGMICMADTLGNPLWIRKADSGAGFMSAMGILGGNTIVAAGNSVVACFGLDGNMHWSVELNEESFDPQSLLLTSDTTFVIAGKFFSDASQKTEAYLMELSATGAIYWTKSYYTTNNTTTFGSVKQAPGGGFWVVGATTDYSVPGATNGVFVTRLDRAGNVVRTSLYSRENVFFAEFTANDLIVHNDHLTVFMKLGDNNILLQSDTLGNVLQGYEAAGMSWWSFILTPGHSRLVQTSDGGFAAINEGQFGNMIKTDALGMPLWTSDLVLDAKTVTTTPDGGYVILGNGPLLGVDDPIDYPHLGLIKTDANGNSPQCAYSSNLPPQNPVDILMQEISLTGEPMLITASSGPDFVENTLYSDQRCVDFTGRIRPVASDHRSLILTPNPASTSFSVVSSDADLRDATLMEICNTLGEPVVSLVNPFRLQNSFNISNLPSGFYLVTIVLPRATLAGKLIISH